MDRSQYERFLDDVLNCILWRTAKGPNVPYPAPLHSAIMAQSSLPSLLERKEE
jgi:hypothetical protein